MSGHRNKRLIRDRKYTMGVDYGVDFDTTVFGHWEDGRFHVDLIERSDKVIEGQAVEVERRPERLLDAGGSEP